VLTTPSKRRDSGNAANRYFSRAQSSPDGEPQSILRRERNLSINVGMTATLDLIAKAICVAAKSLNRYGSVI